MNRRDFIQKTTLFLGTVGAASVTPFLSAKEMTHLAGASAYITKPATIFNTRQRQLIAAMSEAIIPRTDTPGAIDAKVPKFIELMVQEWLNEQEKAIFWEGLNNLETEVPKQYGAPFDELSTEQQLAVLEKMEEQALSSSWYRRGNIHRPFVSDAPFICQVKELTIWGFFTSEVGVTKVLEYNPMPMRFDGHYPKEGMRATWAKQTFYS